ncbi:transposase [Microvirga flocculans]|uniref:Transposase n=1 Tax=Microvirga flocculans TaxID=217168 RepID=A0A7W6ICM2_9HYPH|nr:IS5 family transposase [Microvirga flocculans]MBB4038711.1 transposase [Microvirga flocculans]
MELSLETLLALEPGGRVRSLLRGLGGSEQDRSPDEDVRHNHRTRPCLGGWGKRGQSRQALGRSRGGFSTKIHLKTDWNGDPLGFHLTGSEVSDSSHFETLLDVGPDITPRAAVGDKDYDAKANRQAARSRGICPTIPYRTTTKEKPKFFPKALYRARARIEQTIGKLKRFKRVALPREETDENYGSFVALAPSFILIKPVHTT